jgi:hypothetical protein
MRDENRVVARPTPASPGAASPYVSVAWEPRSPPSLRPGALQRPFESALTRDAARGAALAAALPESRLRALADKAVSRLEQLLDATARQPVVQGGAVVDHIEVPDNSARLRAVAEALTLLGVKGSARGAAAPQRVEVRVAQFGSTSSRPLVDVTPRDSDAPSE